MQIDRILITILSFFDLFNLNSNRQCIIEGLIQIAEPQSAKSSIRLFDYLAFS
jgi:hypothetical protein